jgi:glycerate-2-kinase
MAAVARERIRAKEDFDKGVIVAAKRRHEEMDDENLYDCGSPSPSTPTVKRSRRARGMAVS